MPAAAVVEPEELLNFLTKIISFLEPYLTLHSLRAAIIRVMTYMDENHLIWACKCFRNKHNKETHDIVCTLLVTVIQSIPIKIFPFISSTISLSPFSI